jgi:hypothetical protein
MAFLQYYSHVDKPGTQDHGQIGARAISDSLSTTESTRAKMVSSHSSAAAGAFRLLIFANSHSFFNLTASAE